MTIIADRVTRGDYVQFRVKAVGTRSGYDSDFTTSGIMRKNSVPSNISSVSVTPTSLEYSNGDNITISWSKPTDIDNNIYKYSVRLYPNATNTSIHYEYETTNTSFTLLATDSHYKEIANNQKLFFEVQPIDIFGKAPAQYTKSAIITRYDTNGVAIGIDGKWVDCQVFVGEVIDNGESMILNNESDWSFDGLNRETGEQISWNEYYMMYGEECSVSDYLSTDSLQIQMCVNKPYTQYPYYFCYYDEKDGNKVFKGCTFGSLSTTIESPSNEYKYVRILFSSSTMYPVMICENVNIFAHHYTSRWVEQDVAVCIGNQWVECIEDNND